MGKLSLHRRFFFEIMLFLNSLRISRSKESQNITSVIPARPTGGGHPTSDIGLLQFQFSWILRAKYSDLLLCPKEKSIILVQMLIFKENFDVWKTACLD